MLPEIKEEAEAEEERQKKDSKEETPLEQEVSQDSSVISTPPVDADVGEELEG